MQPLSITKKGKVRKKYRIDKNEQQDETVKLTTTGANQVLMNKNEDLVK